MSCAEPWITATEGADTWSPHMVMGRLIHGELTDWTFSFEKGQEPDWTKLRAFFSTGRASLTPSGMVYFHKPWALRRSSRASGDAVKNVASYRESFGERIVATRMDCFGYVAHAYVTFEGFVPGAPGAPVEHPVVTFCAGGLPAAASITELAAAPLNQFQLNAVQQACRTWIDRAFRG